MGESIAPDPDTWIDYECSGCGGHHAHVCPECGRTKDRHNHCPTCDTWYCDPNEWARCILSH